MIRNGNGICNPGTYFHSSLERFDGPVEISVTGSEKYAISDFSRVGGFWKIYITAEGEIMTEEQWLSAFQTR